MTRRQVEPGLVTFLPFSDMGPETRGKFTEIDHYDWKYDSNNQKLLEKTEYSYKLNRKNARLNHMVFDMMLRLI